MMYMMTEQERQQVLDSLSVAERNNPDPILVTHFGMALAMLKAMQPAFAPDWSRDSAAAESIREHQAICKMLMEALKEIKETSLGASFEMQSIARAAINQAEKGATP